MRQTNGKGVSAFSMILFRIMCMLLSLVFLPGVAQSMCIDNAQIEQKSQDNFPENGEKKPCGDSECEEDAQDSFLHAPDDVDLINSLSGLDSRHDRGLDIRQLVKEILSPPPQQV